MKTLLLIFVGGGLGSITRFLLSKNAFVWFGSGPALGTLLSNVFASLILGYITAKSGDHQMWRPMLAIGFCGGFSTFSTFSLETFRSLQSGDYVSAFSIILLNVVICLGAIWLGLLLGK